MGVFHRLNVKLKHSLTTVSCQHYHYLSPENISMVVSVAGMCEQKSYSFVLTCFALKGSAGVSGPEMT